MLRFKEHTPEKLSELIKPIMARSEQFENFLNVQTRCQKIDTLERIRKVIEPKSLSNKSARILGNPRYQQ